MPTICRLPQRTPDHATALVAQPSTLAETVAAAQMFVDKRAAGGNALLRSFEPLNDGSA